MLRGSVAYRTIASHRPTGSETWSIAIHPDGSRTLHVMNRIDAAGTFRHVILHVDSAFRPLELSAVFWFDGAWVGTGLFAVDGAQLDAVVATPHGRVTQSLTVPLRFAFVPHPPTSNAWQTGAYDRAAGGVQRVPLYDLQTRLRGPGNVLGPMQLVDMEFVGNRRVAVPAGTFDCDCYRSGETEICVHGPDRVLVRMAWPAVDEEYVLTSLDAGSR